MKNNENTFYAYLLEVIRDLKLKKVYDSLSINDDILDDLYQKSLKILDNFENSNEFNPNLNTTFIIKVLLKVNDEIYLVKTSSKKYGLITLSASLSESFYNQIECYFINAKIENISRKQISLLDNIHINSLLKNDKILKHLDLSKPVIYGIYQVRLEKIDTSNHFKKINEIEKDKINELDLALIQYLEE